MNADFVARIENLKPVKAMKLSSKSEQVELLQAVRVLQATGKLKFSVITKKVRDGFIAVAYTV